ncbi:60s ribosomal protein l19-2, partial [Globisporangium splendens]
MAKPGSSRIRVKQAAQQHNGGDDDENTEANPAMLHSKAKHASTAMHKVEDTTTLQLTKVLRSADAKLSHELLIASEKGKKHATYLLLHQGIDKERCKGMVGSLFDVLDSGYTPLHYAATRGHLEVIQLLLDFGWTIDTRNDALETPLHLAAFSGHTAVAERLLDRGANVNARNEDNETPLFYAARNHHHRVVRLLIRRECDLGLQNRFGDTAQDEATNEKTLMEFAVGNEDAQCLYSLGRAIHSAPSHWNDDGRPNSETLLTR